MENSFTDFAPSRCFGEQADGEEEPQSRPLASRVEAVLVTANGEQRVELTGKETRALLEGDGLIVSVCLALSFTFRCVERARVS
jgi:hypothetical protein